MDRTLRRSGFTLIEMMVIVFIVGLFAYMATPYFIANRDSESRRSFFTEAADTAGEAREMAIDDDATFYLTVDTTANTLNIVREEDTSTYLATGTDPATTGPSIVVNGRTTSTRTQSNIGTETADHSQDKVMKSLPLPTGIKFGNYQLAGKAIDSGSWKMHFFADGTSDGGGVEFDQGNLTKSLVVNTRGGVQLVDGIIPDSSQDSWQAGNYVQRQQ